MAPSTDELQQLIADLTRSQQETDLRFKETDLRFRETDRKIKEAFSLFTSQWGRLVESLVEGDLVRILQERGIAITDTTSRRRGRKRGYNFEFDIIAHNGTEIVVVEVKTTLRPDDLREVIEKLKLAKMLIPEYATYTLYGAVAFLQADAGAERMAENEGLFVIRATGDSAALVNTPDFTPRRF